MRRSISSISLRHGVDLDAEARGRLVDQVDGLVGQEAVGDVAVREHGRRHQRRVLDPHLVVDLVLLLEAAQDRDGVLDRGLAHQHRLEAPLERRVLLDVLPVLVERGGADAAQLAAGQRRLQHVGGVHRALGRARADQRVQLVDEADDLALGLGDLLEHGLQAVLELAAVLGAGDHGAEVERDQALVLAGPRARRRRRCAGPGPRRWRSCRRRARRSAPGCSWSGARAPGSTRRISSSRPMTGSSLPLRAALGQVARVRSSAWYFSSGFGIGDALGAAHVDERLVDGVRRDAAGGQDAAGARRRSPGRWRSAGARSRRTRP